MQGHSSNNTQALRANCTLPLFFISLIKPKCRGHRQQVFLKAVSTQESCSVLQMRFSTTGNWENLKIDPSVYQEQRNRRLPFKDPLRQAGKGSDHKQRQNGGWLSVAFAVMFRSMQALSLCSTGCVKHNPQEALWFTGMDELERS